MIKAWKRCGTTLKEILTEQFTATAISRKPKPASYIPTIRFLNSGVVSCTPLVFPILFEIINKSFYQETNDKGIGKDFKFYAKSDVGKAWITWQWQCLIRKFFEILIRFLRFFPFVAQSSNFENFHRIVLFGDENFATNAFQEVLFLSCLWHGTVLETDRNLGVDGMQLERSMNSTSFDKFTLIIFLQSRPFVQCYRASTTLNIFILDIPCTSCFRRNAVARRKRCSQYNFSCTVCRDSFVLVLSFVIPNSSKHRCLITCPPRGNIQSATRQSRNGRYINLKMLSI